MAITRSTGRSGRSETASKSRSGTKRSGPGLLKSLLRRTDVKTVSISSLDSETLTIDEIAVGNSTVETIAISNIQTQIDIGNASLNNVRTITNLDISVAWEIDLWLFGDSDSFRIGSIPIPFTVGNVDVPDLDNIDLTIPSVQANETVISIPSVNNLSFNGGVVSDVTVSNIQLPVDGYGLTGLAFDTFSLSHVGVPDASIEAVSIGSIEPNGNITLPFVSTDAISIADVQVPSITSTSPITVNNASADDRRITLINLGFLKVSIVVKPSMTMNIASLTMENMEATSTIDSVSLQNVQFPFNARGVQMTGVGAKQLRVEEISL